MSGINSVGNHNPVQKIASQPIHKQLPAHAAHPAKAMPAADKLELSGVGHLLKALKSNGDVRLDKVAQIKSQIDAGTYETEARLDAAIGKLMDDLSR
jgi:anti-sigma28 factor (negative regulator of flagellin synthesis)